jgi:putative ABC transport system substrate-binding protein
MAEIGCPRFTSAVKLLNKIIWVSLFGLLLITCDGGKSKVYRVGILNGFPKFSSIADTFKEEMESVGYIEGKNIVYDQQVANIDTTAEHRIVEKFVEEKVDLIFAFATSAAVSAKAVTRGTDIPVLFAMAGIEGNNLVDSVRRPGANITGVRYPGPDLTLKRYELLRELLPGLRRLYITYNPDYPANRGPLKVLRRAVAADGNTLVENPVSNADSIRADFEKREAAGDIDLDAILMMPDDISQSNAGWSLISGFASRHRLPVSGAGAAMTDPGVVFRYGPDIPEIGRQAAPLAAKILQGTPPGTIPVVSAEAHLRVNYRLMRELNLTVPEGWLEMAKTINR